MRLYKDFKPKERCDSYLANSLPGASFWQKVKVGRPVDHPTATSIGALEEGKGRPKKA